TYFSKMLLDELLTSHMMILPSVVAVAARFVPGINVDCVNDPVEWNASLSSSEGEKLSRAPSENHPRNITLFGPEVIKSSDVSWWNRTSVCTCVFSRRDLWVSFLSSKLCRSSDLLEPKVVEVISKSSVSMKKVFD